MRHIPDRTRGPVDYGGSTWPATEPGALLPSDKTPRESQLMELACGDNVNCDDALSALFMAAATTSSDTTLRQPAYTDDGYSTFDTLISAPATSASAYFDNTSPAFDFATASTANSSTLSFATTPLASTTDNYNIHAMTDGNGKGVADATQFASFTAADYYTLAPQLRMDAFAELRRSSGSSTLPRASTSNSLSDLVTPGSAFLNPADVFSTPLLTDTTSASTATAVASTSSASVPVTPAQTFGFFASGVPATAPLRQLNYKDPLPALHQHMGQGIRGTPSVDALLSAYDSYVGTPAIPSFGSPHVRAPSSSTLFAPLDEVQAGRMDDVRSLLSQVAQADPAFRQNLVHALVDLIKPSVAYQMVNHGAPRTTSFDFQQQQQQQRQQQLFSGVPATSLLAQAQTLASAATMLDEVSDQSMAASDVTATPLAANEAPLLESLLGLLSPPMFADHVPTMSPDMFSPAMPTAVAPEDMFRSPRLHTISEEDAPGASEDAPLAQYVLSNGKDDGAVSSATKRKRSSVDDGESAKRERFHCDICNRAFSRQYNMRTHRMTHNPDSVDARPHSCEHCPRTFTRKHDLVRHQVMHDSTGAFKCSVCSRAFARLDVLERHVRALHKD